MNLADRGMCGSRVRGLNKTICHYNTLHTDNDAFFYLSCTQLYSINRKIGKRRHQCLQSIIYTLLVGGEKKVIIIL